VVVGTRSKPALPAVRRRIALEILQGAGAIRCEDVERVFAVSHRTASRDIDALVAQGLAVRVHGGAVSPSVARSVAVPP
jgi:DeoR/GlpR family transcriptional regulator of sugar metabolism